jgi:hypothetical protein
LTSESLSRLGAMKKLRKGGEKLVDILVLLQFLVSGVGKS